MAWHKEYLTSGAPHEGFLTTFDSAAGPGMKIPPEIPLLEVL